jgi:hypothetical protein
MSLPPTSLLIEFQFPAIFKKSSYVMRAVTVFRLTLSTSQGFAKQTYAKSFLPIISLKSMRKLYERSGIQHKHFI